MGWKCVIAALAAALVGAGSAAAGGVEISPFGAFRAGGELEAESVGETELDEGFSYGLVVDVPTRSGVMVEFLWSHQSAELQLADGVFGSPRVVDFDVDYYHVGALWYPREWQLKRRPGNRGRLAEALENERRKSVRPFATATVGVGEWNPRDVILDSETFASLGLGGGVKLMLARRVGLRFEGRVFGNFRDGSGSVFCGEDGCLGRVSGSFLWQVEAAAGLIFRF